MALKLPRLPLRISERLARQLRQRQLRLQLRQPLPRQLQLLLQMLLSLTCTIGTLSRFARCNVDEVNAVTPSQSAVQVRTIEILYSLLFMTNWHWAELQAKEQVAEAKQSAQQVPSQPSDKNQSVGGMSFSHADFAFPRHTRARSNSAVTCFERRCF